MFIVNLLALKSAGGNKSSKVNIRGKRAPLKKKKESINMVEYSDSHANRWHSYEKLTCTEEQQKSFWAHTIGKCIL
jgi:hypothetical protein